MADEVGRRIRRIQDAGRTVMKQSGGSERACGLEKVFGGVAWLGRRAKSVGRQAGRRFLEGV